MKSSIVIVVMVAIFSQFSVTEAGYHQYIEIFGGHYTLTDGTTIAQNLYLKQGSTGTILGGEIGNFLVLDDTSTASMYGGHIVSGISSPAYGQFDWHGGIIDGVIRSGWRSVADAASYHKIYGYDLKIDGQAITDNVLLNLKDRTDEYGYLYSSGRLTGFLEDGTVINNDYVIYGDSAIELVLIPEPMTLSLLGIGTIMLRRKR